MSRQKRTALLHVTMPRDHTASLLNAASSEALAAGFDGLEVPLGTLPGFADQVLQIGASSGFRVAVVAAMCRGTDVETVLADLLPILHGAADLGASCLNLTLAPVHGSDAHAAEHVFGSYQAALNFAYQLLRQARFDAEATGVALALEAAAGGSLLSPVELRELIDAANSWAVGACVDTRRVRRVGRVADWLATLGHRVHAFRWHAVGPVAGDEPAVAGEEEGHDVARALDGIAYERPVIAGGPQGPAALRRALEVLGWVPGRPPVADPPGTAVDCRQEIPPVE